MSAKFTPGKWSVDYMGANSYSAEVVGLSPRGKRICVARLPKPSHGDVDANAGLMAAAPELYAALKAMVENACAACDVLDDGTHRINATKSEWDAHVAATEVARAALAKAVQP